MPNDSQSTSTCNGPWDCVVCGSAGVDPGNDQPLLEHCVPGMPYRCSASGLSRVQVLANIFGPSVEPVEDLTDLDAFDSKMDYGKER